MTSYDEIFTTEESRAEARREKIQEIPLSELQPFKDHPFRVVDDERMMETVESIREYGILVPAIARPIEGGGYEIVAGHRRKRAAELAGLETMPIIVSNLDDDEATIIMVDSNLQRENILPSERAMAYKMKLEAIKHQGERRDLTCGQLGHKLEGKRSIDIVAEESSDSRKQVQRYIRLTELTPELQIMVDDKRLAFNPAVELSYLKPEEQEQLAATMEMTQTSPSLSQAQRMKKFSQEGRMSGDAMLAIMSEEKKPLTGSVTLRHDTLKKYFPKTYTEKQRTTVILKLLDSWLKKRQRDQER